MKSDNPCISQVSFTQPNYLPAVSAWKGHGPFALWIVDALKPRTVVELGTHYGFSYFCFCQEVAALGLKATCTAIDTWKGDEQAGFYDESVFETVNRINSQNYADFSRLVRSTFADAVSGFADKSIDLLHIDGRHRFEDVKEDYETWLPKMSDRGVILFHDTQVTHEDFGVYKYWPTLAEKFPSFEFLHCYGLGVLGVGTLLPAGIRPLFEAARDETAREKVRNAYARLGAALAGQPLRRVEPCPCGSGERYKHCCGSLAA